MVAPARPVRVLLGLTTLTTVSGVVGSLGSPLVPAIAATEGVPLSSAQWALTVTLLVGAVVTPVIGRLGVGRRRRPVMVGCLVLVAVGTLLAALPLGFAALVAGRALQGVAFGITALAVAVAREVLPPDRVVAGLARLSVAQVVSAGLGFPVAAVLAEVLGVKGAFGAAFVLTAGCVAVGVLTVPRGDRDAAPDRVDWIGATLLTGGTLALLLAVSVGPAWGYLSLQVLSLLTAGLVLLAGSASWLLRTSSPLVDLRLATRGGALGANLAALVAGTGLYLMMSTVMILVQAGGRGGYGLGLSVTVSGMMLVPYSVASLVGSGVSLRVDRRVGPDVLLALGCLGFAVANLLLVGWHSQVWHLVLAMLVGGAGGGAVFNAIPRLLVRAVPPEETGSAMSFNIVLRFLGFSLGSALSVAVLDRYADAASRPTESGFVVVALVGLGTSLLAAAGCYAAARSVTRAAGLPGPAVAKRS